jgi:hypothetical protein
VLGINPKAKAKTEIVCRELFLSKEGLWEDCEPMTVISFVVANDPVRGALARVSKGLGLFATRISEEFTHPTLKKGAHQSRFAMLSIHGGDSENF